MNKLHERYVFAELSRLLKLKEYKYLSNLIKLNFGIKVTQKTIKDIEKKYPGNTMCSRMLLKHCKEKVQEQQLEAVASE